MTSPSPNEFSIPHSSPSSPPINCSPPHPPPSPSDAFMLCSLNRKRDLVPRRLWTMPSGGPEVSACSPVLFGTPITFPSCTGEMASLYLCAQASLGRNLSLFQ
eukprot:RCo007154